MQQKLQCLPLLYRVKIRIINSGSKVLDRTDNASVIFGAIGIVGYGTGGGRIVFGVDEMPRFAPWPLPSLVVGPDGAVGYVEPRVGLDEGVEEGEAGRVEVSEG